MHNSWHQVKFACTQKCSFLKSYAVYSDLLTLTTNIKFHMYFSQNPFLMTLNSDVNCRQQANLRQRAVPADGYIHFSLPLPPAVLSYGITVTAWWYCGVLNYSAGGCTSPRSLGLRAPRRASSVSTATPPGDDLRHATDGRIFLYGSFRNIGSQTGRLQDVNGVRFIVVLRRSH